MANDDLPNPKNFDKKFLSTVSESFKGFLDKQRRSPVPSEGSRGGVSLLTRFLKPKGRVTPSNSSAFSTPDDHRGLPVLSGTQTPTTVPEALNLPSRSSAQDPSTGHISNSATTEDNSQSTEPVVGSSTKEHLELTGRALRTLAKKAASIVDENPAKVALGLVKAIIDIYNAVKDNKDAVARQIASTGGHLKEVEDALRGWKPSNKEGFPWIDHFKTTLKDELQGLERMRDESNFRKFLDHEDEQERIKVIFVRINEARVRFELSLGIRVFKAVYEVDQAVRALFLDRLKPSDIAHHDYILEGREEQLLRRQVCTPGTRVRILDDIITWAKDTSPDSPNVYWLFGHAGSGKTTISYTIARRFEFAGDSDDAIVLGGNFFCSRQFEETSLSKYIIRTIVYHLALKCKHFADALVRSGRLDTISQNHRTQLDSLLFGPWLESEGARLADPSGPPCYLIVIDALDEIDGKGGSELLKNLVNVINKIGTQRLSGLKFFTTSRSDPDLVAHVDSLEKKQLYRLQDVKEEEVRADVATYLNASIPHLKGQGELQDVAEQAAGLFIYAATVVKLLGDRKPLEQKDILRKLSTSANLTSQSSLQNSDALLNQLYHQILVDAFGRYGPDSEERRNRLSLLFTFLCAKEPLSILTVTQLLFEEDTEATTEGSFYTQIGDDVLERLHSVLYVENGRVLSYHKSFPDFIFDRTRSGDFSCDRATHHRQLTSRCFWVMEGCTESPGRFKGGLMFNIANIPSSFILDKDNQALVDEVKRNISPALGYSCRSWDHHLSFVEATSSDPLFETLSGFLQLRALFWIEAMNLLNLRGQCSLMLQTACQWVIKAKESGDSGLSKNLMDAASFALYFSGSGAASSTPHLYISALASSPGKLDICSHWKNYFPRIPRFSNAQVGGMVLMMLKLDSAVTSVAISRDGRCIVSGSADNSVRVWDALTGDTVYALNGHTNVVTSIAISRDGSRIASGSNDEFVRVWDASTGDEVHVLRGHGDVVSSVAISSDGTRIVSGSGDESIRVWDASTGRAVHVLNGHTDRVTSVAISRDGSHIVSGSYDNSIRVWDASTGDEVHVLNGHTSVVTSVAISRDGSRIISGSGDHSVWVWDASTGNEVRVLNGHTDRVSSVAISRDGSRIVSGSYDDSIRVWDASTGDEMHVLKGHTNRVTSVAISKDSSRIVSGSGDHSIRVWDVLTGDKVHVLNGHTDWVTSVAISRDGSRIVSGFDDHSIRVWDASTGDKVLVLNGHTDWVASVAISKAGSHIVSGSHDNFVRVWDASTGDEVHVLNGHTRGVTSVAISKDGRRIVSGSLDKSIRVWDTSTGDEVHVLKGHTRGVTSVVISKDGTRFVSGSSDSSIRVWDASTSDEVHVLNGHTGWVTSVAISKVGSRIVSGSYDGSVRVWDASTGNEVHVLNGHTNVVTSVAISKDGSRIVSGSLDKSIRVWDASTGDEVHVLKGHTRGVTSVVISKDGSSIVSGSSDSSIRVWDASTSQESRYIREKAARSPIHDEKYTGWLLSPDAERKRLFWAPNDKLPDDANILTIPYSAAAHIDFTHSTLGPDWYHCYSP